MHTQNEIDTFQERMLHIASGLELLRSMDGDEPGYCYLKNSLCADIERHLDDCERLMPRVPRKVRKNGAARPVDGNEPDDRSCTTSAAALRMTDSDGGQSVDESGTIAASATTRGAAMTKTVIVSEQRSYGPKPNTTAQPKAPAKPSTGQDKPPPPPPPSRND